MLMRLVRGQVSGARKRFSHVVWTQIPSTVLPPGQMAKCENCDSVHWQRQQSSVQVRESETGVEKVKRNGFNAQALKCSALCIKQHAARPACLRGSYMACKPPDTVNRIKSEILCLATVPFWHIEASRTVPTVIPCIVIEKIWNVTSFFCVCQALRKVTTAGHAHKVSARHEGVLRPASGFTQCGNFLNCFLLLKFSSYFWHKPGRKIGLRLEV